MAEVTVTVDGSGAARVQLSGPQGVEIRHAVALDALEEATEIPALGTLVLLFDHYGRLAAIEVTDSAASVLSPGLLGAAR